MNQTPDRSFHFGTVFCYYMTLQVRFKTKGLLCAALVWALSAFVVYSIVVFAFDTLALLFNNAKKLDSAIPSSKQWPFPHLSAAESGSRRGNVANLMDLLVKHVHDCGLRLL